ncbi:DUF6242 domain-containing protein [Viscerimonas tarda]
MRLRHITYLCLSLLFIFSCKDDTESVTYDQSKDAQIYSFSLAASFYKSEDSIARRQDSILFRAFTAARFAINQVTGTIYNPDSLPYGLKPRKVKLTLTFNEAYGGVSKFEIHVPDSADFYEWNSTDSVDFSKMPVLFRTVAPYSNVKEYKIDLRIHQIDPDTIVWQQMPDFEAEDGKQKVLTLNNTFYAYSLSGSSASLFTTSSANLLWENKALQNFPLSTIIESICIMGNSFFAITEEGDSYSSVDGISWEKQNNGENVLAIYGVLPSTKAEDDLLLVALKQSDGKNYYGTTKDLKTIDVIANVSSSPNDASIQAGFPVKGFSAITNYNRGGHYNLLIVNAGLNADGKDLNSTWLVRKSAEGLEMAPSVKNPFFAGKGTSAFLYNNYLYVLAKVSENGAVKNKLFYSKSWGEIWGAVPGKQATDPAMLVRSEQSVIVDDKNYIWIFGGISKDNAYLKDSWRGRLNKLNVN